MYKVTVLLFATLRDYVGERTIQMELPIESTIADLKEFLINTHPRLSPIRNSMMAAVNREYAADEQIIPINAEIAFFPPVSGG